MNILNINTYDLGGGAEKIVSTLHKSYLDSGIDSNMLVKEKKGVDKYIYEFNNCEYSDLWGKICYKISGCLRPYRGKIKGVSTVRNWLEVLAQPRSIYDYWNGRECFNFPASEYIENHIPLKPDIIHFHNLHGNYFDLRTLAKISNNIPSVITLHDQWLMTGHCAFTFNCERWKTGCGNCPDLTISPGVKKDATNYNWERKKDIYSRSQLSIVTPSEWMMKKVFESSLSFGMLKHKVINNGVNTKIFCKSDKNKIRQELDLPLDAAILVFAAYDIKTNRFKDFATIKTTFEILAEKSNRKILVLALGDTDKTEIIGKSKLEFIPYVRDESKIAKYYQAADVYIHAAKSDNFPTTILEALACGTPVVATNIDGIPEQVIDGVNGCLVPPSCPNEMAEAIISIIEDESKRISMSENAYNEAKTKYSQETMVKNYLNLYSEILEDQKSEIANDRNE